MDGIRTGHARCVLAACALVAALIATGPASAASRKYGGLLGRIPARHVVAYDFRSRDEDPHAASTAQGSGQLTYHGGPVMRTNRVYAIYWVPQGYTVSAAYRSTIDGFFANVAADSGRRSNVYALNTQYGDSTGLIAYSTTFAGSTLDTQPFPANGCSSILPTCLTNAQLVAEIARVATQNGWTRGVNSLFFVFTPRNVTNCWDPGGTFCFLRQYCAYHSWYQDAGGLIVFANMPYAATGAACGAGWLNSPNGDDADATINVASHEHVEAITDPVGNAWYDSSGYENGDKCAWDFGTQLGGASGSSFNQRIGTGTYELQQEYSNAASGCLLQATPIDDTSPPANTAGPSIAGTAKVGQVLTANPGTWTGATPITYSYLWTRCTTTCVAIAGASGSAYTPVLADVGATLRVLVTAANSFGSGQALSPQTAAVTGGTAPVATAPPTVAGSPRVGQTLGATSGSWTGSSPIGFAYAWQRCRNGTCSTISGPTRSTYAAAPADVGYSLRVTVTASNAYGRASAYSEQTAAVAAVAPWNTSAPTISGTPRVGQKLTAAHGTWSGGGTTSYEYVWLRCSTFCTAISGANASSYVVGSTDRGWKLRVFVWATNEVGRSGAYSALTATVS